MSLSVELGPGERLIIGNTVITNWHQRTRLKIDGKMPLLRETDFLEVHDADTPAKLIYLSLQQIYLEGTDPLASGSKYPGLVATFSGQHPTSKTLVQVIDDLLNSGDVYRALKVSRRLRSFEAAAPQV